MIELTVDEFFKPGGLIAQVKPNFKQRNGQAELSALLNDACASKQHVVAEGPTGFGKSFSLLVPAIIQAVTHGKRVVISTETLALQDQYVHIDLPMLREATRLAGYDFTFATAKGRNNFVCKNKLNEGLEEGVKVVTTPIERWAMKQQLPQSGDRATIPEDVEFYEKDWMAIAADDDCERRGCPFYKNGSVAGGSTDCFVYQARRSFLEAQIVVTNHTLLLLDRQNVTDVVTCGPLLDHFDLLIVDEGHTLAEKAQATWGYEFGPHTMSNTMRGLQRMLNRAGVTDAFEEDYLPRWQEMEAAIFAPFASYTAQSIQFEKIRSFHLDEARAAKDVALAAMKAQYKAITAASRDWEDTRVEDAAASAKDRLSRMYKAMQAVFQGDAAENDEDPEMHDNWLSFVETNETNRGPQQRLKVKPIEVGPLMSAKLFKTISTVVVASATLRVQKSFRFIRREMGMPKETIEFVGKTPFNFREAVEGYFPIDLPWPPDRNAINYNQELRTYNAAAADRIVQLIEHTGGGALILFTSVQSMKDIYVAVRARIDVKCMCQGDAPKHVLIKTMKEDVHSCLFATKSFFTGVDIAGEGLRLLILMRAPFRVPNDPMFAARCDKVKARGGNDFSELSMPLMLMDLLQGFGRLIRTETDSGIFALLDARANSKSYGRDIINALPNIGTLEL